MNFSKWLYKNLELFLGGICLSVIVILVSANVLMRYALNSPISGVTELATIFFVWLVMLGISAAAFEKLHPKIDFLQQILPVKLRVFIESVIMILVIILLFNLIIRGWDFAISSGLEKKSGILEISYIFVYLSLPIGFGLMLIRVLVHFFSDIKQIWTTINPQDTNSSNFTKEL